MPFLELLKISIESLRNNPFRTVLTMLGMIIGVGAVVLLVAVGSGAKTYVLSEFEGLGTNLIIVQPGRTDKKSSFGPPMGSSQRKMTITDVVALERRALTLEAVTGLVYGTVTARYNENISNLNVFGSNENLPKILFLPLREGSFFSREEDDYGRRVIILGDGAASTLFGEENPLGKLVKVNETEFRVLGILQRTGSKLGFNIDDFLFMPTRAALRLFNDDKLFGIRAKAWSRSSVDDAVREVEEILRDRRDGEEDFTVMTQASMMESMESILGMLTYVLAAIASISMVVGGIGIMNIMLVSVTERIPEIGIRRAIGARRITILTQFLVEALILSILSGLIGLLGATGISLIFSWAVAGFDLTPPWWIIPPAFLLSVIVGVVFGVWPAYKASRIEVLEALRQG